MAIQNIFWNVTNWDVYDIYVLISPFNDFLEMNYSNNIAYKTLDVRFPPVIDFEYPVNGSVFIERPPSMLKVDIADNNISIVICNQLFKTTDIMKKIIISRPIRAATPVNHPKTSPKAPIGTSLSATLPRPKLMNIPKRKGIT